MGREIKFRAWNGIKMRYEVSTNSNKNKGSTPVRKGYQWFSQDNDIHESYLEQFTGLQDKNGVDIYEGDIVKQKREDNCYGGFLEPNTVIIGRPEYNELSDWSSVGPDGNYPIIEMEIIGNIHANPELLN